MTSGDSQTVTHFLAPVLGEYVWHAVTSDLSIPAVSDAHFNEISAILAGHAPRRTLSILEVGAYAHYTGDLLAARFGHDVTLFDIAASSLRSGRRAAQSAGIDVNTVAVRRVAGDFHQLPFPDGAFDVVLIASSLHHTWRWPIVMGELVRVTAGGGLLFLQNEPCLRACCAYGFRTNRPEQWTALEQKLDDLGLLRFVAEPYFGSRPETLFGMTENHRIPLDELLAMARGGCDIISLDPNTVPCIGPLEQAMIDDRHIGSRALVDKYVDLIGQRLDEARAAETDATRGLGFQLPDARRVRRLVEAAAERLCSASFDASDEHRRLMLAETFGAAVKMLLRRDPAAPTSVPSLTSSAVRVEGVDLAYPLDIRDLLLDGALPMADIQADEPARVSESFPATDWAYGRDERGHASVSLIGVTGTMALPASPDGDAMLVLLRAHLGVGCRPFVVTLESTTGTSRGFSFPAFRSEAVLLRTLVPSGGQATLRVTSTEASAGPFDGQVVLSYAAVIRVPARLANSMGDL